MTALNLLAQAAIMAVVALGAWTAMGEGMILHWFAKMVEKTKTHEVSIEPHDRPTMRHVTVKRIPILPMWIQKPLATCPRCMCSIWGIVVLLALGYDFSSTWNIVQLPVLILAAVGIQELLYRP